MKSIFEKLFIASILLTTLTFAKVLQLDQKKILDIKRTTGILSKASISIVDGVDMGTYYFLKLKVKQRKGNARDMNAFLEKESGVVYIGTRYEKNAQRVLFPVTEKVKEIVKEGISFSYGTGKKDLYVFTDPECSYCKKFEKQSQGMLSDYRVHVILFPLRFHKKAPKMVEWILQGKDDADKKQRTEKLMVENDKSYLGIKSQYGSTFHYSKEVQEQVDKAIKAANALGISGTPTVLDANFQKLNWKTLLFQEMKHLKTFGAVR